MDPNATLRRIQDSRRTERREACQDLDTWLRGGGFQPDWRRHPEGTRAFRRYLRAK